MNLQWPEDSFEEECRKDDQKRPPKGNGGDIGGELTEDALALRFSERHADDLRYIATKGTWLKWDGIRWYPEATHLAFDLARQSCRADAKFYGNRKPPANVY